MRAAERDDAEPRRIPKPWSPSAASTLPGKPTSPARSSNPRGSTPASTRSASPPPVSSPAPPPPSAAWRSTPRTPSGRWPSSPRWRRRTRPRGGRRRAVASASTPRSRPGYAADHPATAVSFPGRRGACGRRGGEGLLADSPGMAVLIVDEAGAEEGVAGADEDAVAALEGADRPILGIGAGFGHEDDRAPSQLVVDHPLLGHAVDRIGARGAVEDHPEDQRRPRLVRHRTPLGLQPGTLLRRRHPRLVVRLEPGRPGGQHHGQGLELDAGLGQRPLHRRAGELLPERAGAAVDEELVASRYRPEAARMRVPFGVSVR